MIAYQSDLVTIHLARAEEVLPSLATESVDLVVTDPPYGVEYRSGFRAVLFDPIEGDGSDVLSRACVRDVLEQCVRIVGQNRHLYVFGPLDVLDGLKVSKPVDLIWDKTMMSGGDLAAAWGPAHEPIRFVVSKHRHAGQAGSSPIGARLRKGTVLRFARPTGRKVRHPSEKPVPLLRELIESSSRQGETVVDPYAGVGSTGVAAVMSGRRAVLVETEQAYVDIAIERIRAAEALVVAIP